MIKLGDVEGVVCPVREMDRVVVAGDTGGKPALRAFPTMVDLDDGELLVGYDLARDHHATPPMAWMMTRSFDGGRTWGESFALCALPGYHVTGHLGFMKCPDGSIMCSVARAYYPSWRQFRSVSLAEVHVVPDVKPFADIGYRRYESFLIRSWDKGYNWTPLSYPFELFPYSTSATHTTGNSGPYELSDGRWMWPVQGQAARDATDSNVAGVTYSSDQGTSWSPVKVIFSPPYGAPSEQRILKLEEKRFLAYTRVDPYTNLSVGVGPLAVPPWKYGENEMHFSLSEDEGETWSEPWRSNFLGSGGPEVHQLNDKSLLAIYRDMDPDRHGVNVSHSEDEGRTWSFVGQLCGPSEASTWGTGWELGYPVSLRVSDGLIFVVYYGPWANGNADVVGVYLEDLTSAA